MKYFGIVHVDALCSVDGLRRGAIDAFAAQHVTHHVDHLQGGVTLVVDDKATIAVESEGL